MLYRRIVNEGTINEPDGKPDPQFALPATINWMHAIRILAEEANISFVNAESFYVTQIKRSMSPQVENTILEQLFLALHHLSALTQFTSGSNSADFARVGILAWYYGIANSASAMTAAQSGAFQEDHAGTARIWDEEIAKRGFAMEPFNWRISSLMEKKYKLEVDAYKSGSGGTLQVKPNSKIDAIGASAAYLSGSAKWYAWRASEDLRRTKEFKALNVNNFRTKAAQTLRDNRLDQKCIGFVHQASRYRGKANYREALFLGYGASTQTLLKGFCEDLTYVLRGFLTMAGAFAKCKLGKELWSDFVADVDSQRSFSIAASSVWK